MKRNTIAKRTRFITPLLGVTCTMAALALSGCKGGTGGTGEENAAAADTGTGAADTNAPTSSDTKEPAATNQMDTSSQGDTNSGTTANPDDTNAPPTTPSDSDTNTDNSSGGA